MAQRERPIKAVLSLTEGERSRLVDAAKAGDYRTTADFIRMSALRAANEIADQREGTPA